MICELYTLKKEYRDKKIYIWNVNRDSMLIFVEIALRKIDIQGFVSIENEVIGEMYMNRPIISLEQAAQENDSIIIVSYKYRVPKERVSMIPHDKCVYWEDALELNDDLRWKRIIVYGIGHGAEQICRVLENEGIEVELYCVTKKNKNVKYKGKTVIRSSDLALYEDYAVIISVLTDRYRGEILEALSDYKGNIYIENIRGERAGSYINLIPKVWLAVNNHSNIYIYSKRNMVAELIEEMLCLYGIKISGYVYETVDRNNNIESIYEIGYEGVENKLIIINEELPERLIRARENIELAGFSLEGRNYTGISKYTCAKEELLSKLPLKNDVLVNGSILYSQDKPGWKLYGKEEKDRIRIVVLGGSTSSEIFHPEHWISKLYYRMNKENIKATIYNGAHAGNSLVIELLRLLRDIFVIKPHIVISMSGINNVIHTDLPNQFNIWGKHEEYCYGLCSDESLYSFWNRNQKLMKVISEFHGAEFFGFLQPMNVTMEHMSLWEKSFYEEDLRYEGAREFSQYVTDGEVYINLMRVLEHQDEMYIDACHYSARGHEVIANKVYEAIMPTVRTLISKGTRVYEK